MLSLQAFVLFLHSKQLKKSKRYIFLFLYFVINRTFQFCFWIGKFIQKFIILVTSPIGFKSTLTEAYVTYTFPEIHLWCDTFVYNTIIAASHLPLKCLSAEVGYWDMNRRPPAWQSDFYCDV